MDLTRIKPRNVVFWVGVTLYAASFAMYSVIDPVNKMQVYRGYEEVWIAFLATVLMLNSKFGMGSLDNDTLVFVASVFVLLINPVFIVALLALLRRRHGKLFVWLRVLLLLLLPSCWVVFHDQQLIPIHGYYIWSIGMLLAIFAVPDLTTSAPSRLRTHR